MPFEAPIIEPTYETFKNPKTNEYIKQSLMSLGLPDSISCTAMWIKWQIILSFKNGLTIALEKWLHYKSQWKKEASDIVFTDAWKENLRIKIIELNRIINSTRVTLADFQSEIQSA